MSTGVLSKRSFEFLTYDMILKDVFLRIGTNVYNEETNKEGIINLCTAQNNSVCELMAEKLNQPGLLEVQPSMCPYPKELNGSTPFRTAIASFLTRQFKTAKDLEPNQIATMNGVTALLSTMAYVLCEQGETILSPCPMYGAIPMDTLFMAGAKIFPVHLSGQPGPHGRQPYELTPDMLEASLEEARAKGHKVKALLLINPFNPVGIVYTKAQVLSYLQFCQKHELHCVIDEVYGCSIYDSSVEMSSVLSFDPEELPDRTKTHVLWGMAKDFGIAGIPVGVVYSWNPDVVNAVTMASIYHQVPVLIQTAVAKILEDREWVESTYLPTNHRYLKESSQLVIETLDELGVPYVKPSAGLFIWADFTKYLEEQTRDAEMKLSFRFLDNGVALAPGAAFYTNEIGKFRIIFSTPRAELKEAMKRLKKACLSFGTDDKQSKGKAT